jgi:dihydroflavonol-4-reductase
LSAKVLITGGTGFIGSYIIRELMEKGYAVRALKRQTSKLPFYHPSSVFDKVEWIEGDVLDIVSLEEAMQDVDAVIHSAAIVAFNKKEKKKMYQVNIDGTANVVNMALEKNIGRLVHISSVAAVGRSKSGEQVNEKTKWQKTKTTTHYALTKHRAEMEVWRAMGEGLHAVIVNPSTVLGYGDWNSSSCRIFKSVYKQFPWYTKGVNGFVDIEDVAKATIRLMETNITDERFILNGDNWSFQKLFNTIADGFGKKHPHRKATPLAGSIAWRLASLKSFFTRENPLLTKESARVAHSNTRFENDKILSVLPGFSFTHLEETIGSACKKYLDAIK